MELSRSVFYERLFVFCLAFSFSVGSGIGYGIHRAFKEQQPATQHLTLAEYERVKPGMLLVDVQALLGPGKEESSSITQVIISWKNSDGSKITAKFDQQRRLLSKAQEGL